MITVHGPPEASLSNAESVLSQLQPILTGSTHEALTAFVGILRSSFAHFNWVGVYLVKEDNLVLEAYAGDAATEHVTIPIGREFAVQRQRPGRQ